jgi:hypothetical protein
MVRQKPAKRPRATKLMRETPEAIAMLRQPREKMALVQELEPDRAILSDYRNVLGRGIIELRRIRAGVNTARGC